ncbi:hypothetical protein [sulfur-oxidizing endosymbiont of Gigantopelta aegis]|uniref:hypothetical protein n=1 Tax=sulfur-oxidizing endosymbiont of Gigantopelta aegis TaxID=2794934 RepID=UPI0018DE450F|nr:hypothetical protein [sulfur-oxidizing endosymbiont of Gigantopelta aegis]
MGNATEMGLAIGAGAIGLVFLNLEQIASLKAAGIEIITKDQKEQLLAVIEKETEPSFIKTEAFSTDDQTKEVVKALKNQRFTWRYLNGLVKDTGLPKEKVKQSLDWLLDNDLGRKSKGDKGDIWSLTQKGREVFLEHKK